MPKANEARRPIIQGLLGVNASGVAATERVIEIPVTAIRPNPDQPRLDFPPESLLNLGQSIKEKGLQHPIIVRFAPGCDHEKPSYELIMGERRLRASQAVGLKTIRAIVRDIPDDDLLRLALIENVHREDLSVLDRAVAVCKFMNKYHHGNAEAAAVDLKISRATGFNYKRIGSADQKYRKLIKGNDLDTRASIFLLGLADKIAKQHPDQAEAFDKMLADGDVSFVRLKQLHEHYFAAASAEAESPQNPPKVGRKSDEEDSGGPARAHVNSGLYEKARTSRVLSLDYDPSKGKPSAQVAKEWVRAATAFFKDAGFRTVEIKQ